MIGEGPAARSIKLDLQPFTLISATTRAGMLTNRCATASASSRFSSTSTTSPDRRPLGAAAERPTTDDGTARSPDGRAARLNRQLRDECATTRVKAQGRIDAAMADAALRMPTSTRSAST